MPRTPGKIVRGHTVPPRDPKGRREGWSPLWSPYGFSGHPPAPGMWAVEPHLGFRGTGAKFEEILMVTDSKDPEQSAFWLDDELPHVTRWRAAEAEPLQCHGQVSTMRQ